MARTKPKGWVNDPYRHGLAAKGIKTTRKTLKEVRRALVRENADKFRIAAVEDTLDILDEMEKTVHATGIVSVKEDSAFWPKEYTIDGEVYHLSSIWPTRRTADMLAEEVRSGAAYNHWGGTGGVSVRVGWVPAGRETAAGKGLQRPRYARNLGGYEQAQWAIYQRKVK